MPEKETLKRAAKARRQGKAASTQAGEFIREELHHVRAGKHGARSAKQAIAIGLSKARRAGVKLGAPRRGSTKLKRQAAQDSARGRHPRRTVSPRRSRASKQALQKEPRSAATHRALSTQAHRSAKQRSGARRSALVTQMSDAMTLEPRVFEHHDPGEVAASIKRSSDRSKRRKATPFRSAMSMLNFYINRAGKSLPARQRAVLERAKGELRALYGKPRD